MVLLKTGRDIFGLRSEQHVRIQSEQAHFCNATSRVFN